MREEYENNSGMKNNEIMLNGRIIPREYLTEISQYKTSLTKNKQNLEKKLIKK